MKHVALGLLAALAVLGCDNATDPVDPSAAGVTAAASPSKANGNERRGPPGFSEWALLTDSVGPNTDRLKTATVMCPAGSRPLGGGWRSDAGFLPVVVLTHESRPLWDGVSGGWTATANLPNANWTLTVYVICAVV